MRAADTGRNFYKRPRESRKGRKKGEGGIRGSFKGLLKPPIHQDCYMVLRGLRREGPAVRGVRLSGVLGQKFHHDTQIHFFPNLLNTNLIWIVITIFQ